MGARCFNIIALALTALLSSGAVRGDSTSRLLPVNIDGLYGYVDLAGAMRIKPRFDFAYPFIEKRAWIYVDGKFGLIDPLGKAVIEPQYQWAWGFSNDRAAVKYGSRWGYVDPDGNEVIAPLYEEALSFSNALAPVKLGGRWGYINKQGKYVLAPQFSNAEDFSEGRAHVVLASTDTTAPAHAFIDTRGNILPGRYEDASSYTNGVAAVKQGGKWGYIDSHEHTAITPMFAYAYPFVRSGQRVLARVRNERGKVGFIDLQGRYVIRPKFKRAESFYDGIAAVGLASDRCSYPFIDLSGKTVFDLQPRGCDTPKSERISSVYRVYDGIYRVYKGRDSKNPYYINTKGEYIWTPTRLARRGESPQPDWYFIDTHAQWAKTESAQQLTVRSIAPPATVQDYRILPHEDKWLTQGNSGNKDYMSYLANTDFRRMETEVLREMNRARTDPQQYLTDLKQRRTYYGQDGKLQLPNYPIFIYTHEGVAAVDDAIHAFSSRQPVAALSASSGLANAARDHVVDQSNTGLDGHYGSDGSSPFDRMRRYGEIQLTAGENVAYGEKTAHQMVLDLIIDDGVQGRGHRMNILNPNFHVVGVACGTHRRIGSMCVMDFAGAFK